MKPPFRRHAVAGGAFGGHAAFVPIPNGEGPTMAKSSLLKRLTGGPAAEAPSAPAAAPAPSAPAAAARPAGYVFPDERAKAIFRALYPGEDPGDFPRAVNTLIDGLREVEAGAAAIADRTMFQKGVEAARREILAVIGDPGACVDPVTHQPTASHFDWRNITRLLSERIEALTVEPPR
jgi:hypothetical protein